MGINLKTNETRNKLITIITESQLQPCILRMMFEELTNQLRRIEAEAIQREMDDAEKESVSNDDGNNNNDNTDILNNATNILENGGFIDNK